jgi:hypothetical protein
MPTVTGNLKTSSTVPVQGGVEVMLCGYGSRVPRVNSVGLIARITDSADIPVGADGTFSFQVYGNDLIAPAGTYYAVTIKDDNGDIAQVNAYRFISTTPNYDLDLIDPYDPNLPPPPLPPPITNLLLILAAAANMVFDGSLSTAFKTTLGGNVTAPVFENMAPGNLYTFIIVQDATGGYQFIWPANVRNATLVDPTPGSTTIQTFVADEFGDLYSIAAGTYYP